MMLKNLVCSAFLAAALADVTTPSPTFMSTITTAECPLGYTIKVGNTKAERKELEVYKNFEQGAKLGECDTKCQENKKCKSFMHHKSPDSVCLLYDFSDPVDGSVPVPDWVFCSKDAVDVVVELGSSKSKIVVVEFDAGGNIKKLKEEGEISTKVTITEDSVVEKGVAGACRTDTWSTEDKCEEHLNYIATRLEKADNKYNIRSMRFLGTAGLRQSPRGVETLQRLQDKIKTITFGDDMEFEYRTLSGVEEAQNEFLALKSAKDGVTGPDRTVDNELLGNIGLGGASVQFAVEEKADQQSGKKKLSLESAPWGMDAAWEELGTDGGDCKIQIKTKTDNFLIEKKYNECKRQVKSTFNKLFQHNNPTHWAQDHLKVYVLGGIYYSITGHFGKDNFGKKKIGPHPRRVV